MPPDRDDCLFCKLYAEGTHVAKSDGFPLPSVLFSATIPEMKAQQRRSGAASDVFFGVPGKRLPVDCLVPPFLEFPERRREPLRNKPAFGIRSD